MEILNFENSLAPEIISKCGSIFYSENLKYFISCINCSEKFYDINNFIEHYDKQHLICTNSDPLISIVTGTSDTYQANTHPSSETDNLIDDKRIIFEQTGSIITPNFENYNEENFKNANIQKVVHNKPKKLICSRCPLSFFRLPALKRHIKAVHIDTYDLVCKICNKEFTSKYRIAQHVRRIHKTTYNKDLKHKKLNLKKFKNSKTEVSNHQSIKARKHKKNTNEDENLEKSETSGILINNSHTIKEDEGITNKHDKIILNKYAMNKNVNNSHKKSNELELGTKIKYTCEICKESFNTQTSLRSHRVKKHSLQLSTKSQQRCNITDKKYRLSALQRHTNISHSNKTDFYCQYCKKSFEKKIDLEKHSKKYHSDNFVEPFTCPICCDLFSTKEKFKRHYKLKHENEKRPHKCSFCEKCFKFPHNKIIHERSHTKEAFAICEFCGLGFISISSLNAHRRRRHSKELNLKIEKKEHKCLTCGKIYKDKSYLAEHSVVHSKIRKHVCSICSESFAWSHVLKRHIMNVHNDSRDFVCKVCEKDFKSRSKVAEHVKRTHKITFNNDLFYKKIKDIVEVDVKKV